MKGWSEDRWGGEWGTGPPEAGGWGERAASLRNRKKVGKRLLGRS